MTVRHHRYPRNKIPISDTVEMWVLLAGLIAALYVLNTDVIAYVVAHTQQFGVVGSFVEGFLFTSVLTTALAVVAFIESVPFVPAWELAFFGAIGAVCGDLLLFRFVRSGLVDRILNAAFHQRAMRAWKKIASGPLWWLGPVLGIMVIASPLPDEMGLVMMGLSHIRTSTFIMLTFVANFGGIYAIALAAQHFS